MIASIVLALHLLGVIPLESAATFLFVVGALMIISELAFTTGIVAFNGILSLYIGYALKYSDTSLFGLELGWGVVLGIAFVEFLLFASVLFIVIRNRRRKATTGRESMVGSQAAIVEWKGDKGRVRIQGEVWQAVSDHKLELKKDEKVTVETVDDLTLKIKP